MHIDPVNGFYILTEEQLRLVLIDLTPQIRHDVEIMTDLMRELVKIERKKLGLDDTNGSLILEPNREKNRDNAPDLIGAGKIGGRFYQAYGRILQTQKVKIDLLPKSRG
jgi:hypothetical protein